MPLDAPVITANILCDELPILSLYLLATGLRKPRLSFTVLSRKAALN
jgi:hypothetical protein